MRHYDFWSEMPETAFSAENGIFLPKTAPWGVEDPGHIDGCVLCKICKALSAASASRIRAMSIAA
jgi:hypothetical protein